MPISRELIEIVACPKCKGTVKLKDDESGFVCAACRLVYPVIDGFEGDPEAEGPMKGQRRVDGWRNAGLPWTTKLDRAKMYGLN
jgi:hypothetical protein